MSTTTFHHGSNDHASADALHAVAEFPVSWFEATPASLVLRPVSAFLGAWLSATPVGLLMNSRNR